MSRKTRKVRTIATAAQWSKIADYLKRYGDIQFRPHWKYDKSKRFVLSQIGGGTSTIAINNQIFEYNEDSNTNIAVITGKFNGSHECFRIDFETHTNGQLFAILSSLDGNKTCSTDGSAKSANILRAAVELAREKGAYWIELTDNSKICKDTNVPSVSLADYYFLSRAKTWYETIYPFQPDDLERIADTREQIRNTSWDNMITILKRRFPTRYKKMLSELPLPLNSIATNEPGSVMTVIRSIPYSTRCAFLHKYMGDIIIALMVIPVNGTQWWLPLTPEANRTSPYIAGNNVGIERNGYNEPINKED